MGTARRHAAERQTTSSRRFDKITIFKSPDTTERDTPYKNIINLPEIVGGRRAGEFVALLSKIKGVWRAGVFKLGWLGRVISIFYWNNFEYVH